MVASAALRGLLIGLMGVWLGSPALAQQSLPGFDRGPEQMDDWILACRSAPQAGCLIYSRAIGATERGAHLVLSWAADAPAPVGRFVGLSAPPAQFLPVALQTEDWSAALTPPPSEPEGVLSLMPEAVDFPALLQAMKAGRVLRLSYQAANGVQVTEDFSLLGITAALGEAQRRRAGDQPASPSVPEADPPSGGGAPLPPTLSLGGQDRAPSTGAWLNELPVLLPALRACVATSARPVDRLLEVRSVAATEARQVVMGTASGGGQLCFVRLQADGSATVDLVRPAVALELPAPGGPEFFFQAPESDCVPLETVTTPAGEAVGLLAPRGCR